MITNERNIYWNNVKFLLISIVVVGSFHLLQVMQALSEIFFALQNLSYSSFFLSGFLSYSEKGRNFLKTKWVKSLGIASIAVFFAVCIFATDIAYYLRPIFAARHSYYDFPGPPEFGAILRALQYFLSFVLMVGVCSIVTKKIKLFTNIGKRTLQIYFLH